MFSGRSAFHVALGAAVGASLRWWVGEAIDPSGSWPWATFCVNLVGAFLLGVVLTATHHRVDEITSDPVRLALGTGFCGALTTFSTLAVEIASLGRDDRAGLAVGYLGASLVGGVAVFGLGRALAGRAVRS